MESNRMNRRVYLDHNASTPVHPEVLAEMLPYFAEIFGNPSSIHAFGREARDGLDRARERVARFLRVTPQEIVFTSGGTESDNFAVKGLAYARGKGHLITSKVEHHAVLRTCQALEAQGFDVTYAGVDALSFSSHKIYGPKGVAGLYIRKGTRMVAVQHGGDHERRRRAGTENVAAVVGLGKAVEVRARDMHAEAERLTTLRNRLIDGVHGRVSEVRLSGHPVERLPGTASFLFRHVESESIVLGLDLKGVGVSAGSACTSGNVEPSHVLVAMSIPLDWAMGAVRCSLGRTTTAEDIDYVIECVEPLVRKLRQVMPVGAA